MKKIIKLFLPEFIISFYHWFLAYLGALIYGFPSRKLVVIGVTGTKGKSTTLEIINAGLERTGEKTALSSSVRIKIGDKSRVNDSGNTMPGRFFLQSFLRKAVNVGCRYALIEVTSEGARQYRHRFIDFNAAVFTNLHPEHIESHGSFKNYREAKLSFFRDTAIHSKKSPKYFFVNSEDENSARFIEVAGGKAVMYGKKDLDSYELSPALMGDFNRENAAAALAALKAMGIPDGLIKETIMEFAGVPGRMEFVRQKPFAVVIDYAHTPDSLENVYQAIKDELKPRNLICVLGAAGGGRDKWKRPKFGEIASKYCDKIILTDEDPFDENPETILAEIKSGVSSGFPKSDIEEIVNRREAIKRAVMMAQWNDAVIITGKGSEPYIRVARGKRITWSDSEVVRQEIEKMVRHSSP